MSDFCEKRASERIEVEVPVVLEGSEAKTRDISWAGIYFMTDQYYATGRNLNFTLDLSHALPGKALQLKCEAEVVRTEKINGKLGVGARINSFQYLH